MEEKISRIVIVGEKSTTYEQKKYLENINDLSIKTLEFSNAVFDFLSQHIILIINISDNSEELEKLTQFNDKAASIIIVGNKSDASLLGIAITAGISAFIDTKHEQHEIAGAIDNILHRLSNAKQKSTFNVLMNAKGGAGASFISSNLAYILSQVQYSKAILVDMDLQFGSLGLNFNINSPKYTITEALSDIGSLDKVSMSGYMEKYSDSLNLLLPSTQDITIPGELEPKALEKLLTLLQDNYNHVVIDLPRLIEPLSMVVMDKADNIVIVLQQNLAQFRDGRRLIAILNKDLEIDLDKIVVIINRYDKNNPLRKDDMVNLLNHDRVYTVTNDFNLAETSANLGKPLYEHSPDSKIAKNLKDISYTLGNIKEEKKKKFLGLF